jgi:hypothetical protein
VINPDALSRQLDEAYRRIRILETHLLGIAPGGPPPTPVSQNTVLVDGGVAGSYYSAGTYVPQTGDFTITDVGTTVILEGALDARMEAWDNYVGPPRREAWIEVQSLFGLAHYEWPFGLNRVNYGWRSVATSIAAGSYTARMVIQIAATNYMHVYGGYLRLTWTH